MRKLRFALALPAIQLALTVALLRLGYWQERHPPGVFDTPYEATAVFVCHGISAPVAPVKDLFWRYIRLPEVSEPLWDALGFDLYDLVFPVGVVILWYIVGRSLDHRISGTAGSYTKTTAIMRAFQVLQVIWGIALFVNGISHILLPARWNNPVGNLLSGTMFLIWSFVLILLPGTKIVTAIRERYFPTKSA